MDSSLDCRSAVDRYGRIAIISAVSHPAAVLAVGSSGGRLKLAYCVLRPAMHVGLLETSTSTLRKGMRKLALQLHANEVGTLLDIAMKINSELDTPKQREAVKRLIKRQFGIDR